MDGYGWTVYDPRHGGSQTIKDPCNGLDLTTDFYRPNQGLHDDSWGVRIKGRPRADADRKLRSTVLFYVGMEAPEPTSGAQLHCETSNGAVMCTGNTDQIESF